MSTHNWFAKAKLAIFIPTVIALLGCQSSTAPEFGMVDWYVSNGSGSSLLLNIYDKVCQRSHFRVRVSRSSDTAISTCANEEGKAEIRYRKANNNSASTNPLRNDVVSSGQSLFLE